MEGSAEKPHENSSIQNQNTSRNENARQLSYGGSYGFDQPKKKRGRPRKYRPLNPTSNTNANASSDGNIVVFDEGSKGTSDDLPGGASAPGGVKRGRGRPAGSVKRHADSAFGGAAGIGFTPHVLMIKPDEDIFSKMMAFSKQGPRTICILSATGGVSKASIKPSLSSENTVTYEGRYEILSLEGAFTLSESNKTGGLNVTLSGPAGQVVGGTVSGMLVAASPVQVVVGSFLEDGKKPKSAPSTSPGSGMLDFGSPPSQGPSSGSSDENGGTPNNNANQQVLHDVPIYPNLGWGSSGVHPH